MPPAQRYRHMQLVDEFCSRLDAILPWECTAVDATMEVKVELHLAAGAILVTNNVRELVRVPGLVLEG